MKNKIEELVRLYGEAAHEKEKAGLRARIMELESGWRTNTPTSEGNGMSAAAPAQDDPGQATYAGLIIRIFSAAGKPEDVIYMLNTGQMTEGIVAGVSLVELQQPRGLEENGERASHLLVTKIRLSDEEKEVFCAYAGKPLAKDPSGLKLSDKRLFLGGTEVIVSPGRMKGAVLYNEGVIRTSFDPDYGMALFFNLTGGSLEPVRVGPVYSVSPSESGPQTIAHVPMNCNAGEWVDDRSISLNAMRNMGMYGKEHSIRLSLSDKNEPVRADLYSRKGIL